MPKHKKYKKYKNDEYETPELRGVETKDLVRANATGDEKIEVEVEEMEIIFPINVYYKLMAYTKLIDVEITGLGIVERNGNKFRITEVFLAEQKVSGGACELTTQGMVQLLDKFHEEGKDPQKIRFWWHSHNSMSTYWSTTDEDTGKAFAGNEYLVSVVTTHSGDMRARINIYNPIKIIVDKVKIVIEYPIPETDILEECKQDIKEFVKKEKSKVLKGFREHQYHDNYYKNGKEDVKPNDIDLHVKEDGGGPFGKEIEDNGVRVMWDASIYSYVGYDMKNNLRLTDEEFRKRTYIDYNDPMFYCGKIVK